jgi:hypothetical protein
LEDWFHPASKQQFPVLPCWLIKSGRTMGSMELKFIKKDRSDPSVQAKLPGYNMRYDVFLLFHP